MSKTVSQVAGLVLVAGVLLSCISSSPRAQSSAVMGLSGARTVGALPVSGICGIWKPNSFKISGTILLDPYLGIWQTLGNDNVLYICGTQGLEDGYNVRAYDAINRKLLWSFKDARATINPTAFFVNPSTLLVLGIPEPYYELTSATTLDSNTGKILTRHDLPIGVFSAYLMEQSSILLTDGSGVEFHLDLNNYKLEKVKRDRERQEKSTPNRGHFLVLTPPTGSALMKSNVGFVSCGETKVYFRSKVLVCSNWNGLVLWTLSKDFDQFHNISGVGSKLLMFSYRKIPKLIVIDKKTGAILASKSIHVIDAFETSDSKFVVLDAEGKIWLLGSEIIELARVGATVSTKARLIPLSQTRLAVIDSAKATILESSAQ